MTKQKETFDYRWGIPTLDDEGYAHIPGFVLRHYAELGVTPLEMMFITHLAARRYNSKGSYSAPSLAKVAKEMGYKGERPCLKMVASLERKGVMSVKRSKGKPSIYDFSDLAKRCLELDQETETPAQMSSSTQMDTPAQMSTSTPAQMSTTPLLKRAPHKEQEKEQETRTTTPPTAPGRGSGGSLSALDIFKHEADGLTPFQKSWIEEMVHAHGEDMVARAVLTASEAGKVTIRYIRGILKNQARESGTSAGERTDSPRPLFDPACPNRPRTLAEGRCENGRIVREIGEEVEISKCPHCAGFIQDVER